MDLVPSPWETIEGLGQELRAGRIRCIDVLEACLARIEAREAEVRAWVVVDREGARARALALDDDLRAGRWHGPLHGIPIGIKDIIDVAGLPTAAGSRRRAACVAAEDAEVVARLRDGGALILGKTVATQFAWIDPPRTRNPWDLGRTPGGSSSGSAAAVAAGMCPGAIGSQTGGSITRPAAYCGVAGLKPTHGRVGLRGVVPLAPSLDHLGPMARTVRDLALIWAAIAGPDPRDPTAAPEPKVPDLEAAPPRIGHPGGDFRDRAEPEALEVLDRTLRLFATSGAEVVEAPLPADWDAVAPSHRTILAAEAAAYHQADFAQDPGDYQPRIAALIAEGMATPAVHYIQARATQARLSRAILASFEGIDVLATLAAPGPAPDPSSTGDPSFNAPWSFTGLPTACFPIGLSPDGLPLGIQLVGRPHDELGLLAAASWCQSLICRER